MELIWIERGAGETLRAVFAESQLRVCREYKCFETFFYGWIYKRGFSSLVLTDLHGLGESLLGQIGTQASD